jgi:hypothetical protein
VSSCRGPETKQLHLQGPEGAARRLFLATAELPYLVSLDEELTSWRKTLVGTDMNTIGKTQSPVVLFVTLSALDDEDLRVCDLINEQSASMQKQVATNPTPTLFFANTSLHLPPDCPPRSLEILTEPQRNCTPKWSMLHERS